MLIMSASIELDGGAAIEVCPMPDAALTVESRTLAAPARPPAAEKDDIDSYNAKMLNIMQAAFKKVVQAKSGDMVEVTPAEGTCASLPLPFRGPEECKSALTLLTLGQGTRASVPLAPPPGAPLRVTVAANNIPGRPC